MTFLLLFLSLACEEQTVITTEGILTFEQEHQEETADTSEQEDPVDTSDPIEQEDADTGFEVIPEDTAAEDEEQNSGRDDL